jgi:hypothetical protein
MYKHETDKTKILQGDIFNNFDYIGWVEEVDGKIVDIVKIQIPFFVVLTQICDLEQDFNDRTNSNIEKKDKQIQSILVCPAYLAQSVKCGQHLLNLGLTMESYNSDNWRLITTNQNKRYHFLKNEKTLGIPDLVIDFKQYYTIPVQVLYKVLKKHYVGSLEDLFREDLSHRFAHYLSRIGLPQK